jgi:hypothetical protein
MVCAWERWTVKDSDLLEIKDNSKGRYPTVISNNKIFRQESKQKCKQ